MSQRYHTRTPAQKAVRRERDRARAAERVANGLAPRLRSPRRTEPASSAGAGRPSEASLRGWYRDSYWYTHRRPAGSMLLRWQGPMFRADGTESAYVARYNPTLPALRFLDADAQ
jgi:hypothetical protein